MFLLGTIFSCTLKEVSNFNDISAAYVGQNPSKLQFLFRSLQLLCGPSTLLGVNRRSLVVLDISCDFFTKRKIHTTSTIAMNLETNAFGRVIHSWLTQFCIWVITPQLQMGLRIFRRTPCPPCFLTSSQYIFNVIPSSSFWEEMMNLSY